MLGKHNKEPLSLYSLEVLVVTLKNALHNSIGTYFSPHGKTFGQNTFHACITFGSYFLALALPT
jgi:hypothetical protein